MRIFAAPIIAAFLMTMVVHPRDADAMENGATQWPSGVQTVIPAILPAPGETALYNYSLYYHADSFKDRNGNDLVPGFDLSVAAEAPRIVHTWRTKLGSWNMSSAVVLAGNYVKVEQDAAPGVHLEDLTFGLNFLYLTRLYLTYNTAALHVEIGPSVFIPGGDYDSNDLANPTVNYFAYQQEFSVTYFPTKTLELSTLAVIDINAENPDTDYRSGAFFSIDWGVNWAPIASTPNLFFGIGGYYINQFTDDEIDGRCRWLVARQAGSGGGKRLKTELELRLDRLSRLAFPNRYHGFIFA